MFVLLGATEAKGKFGIVAWITENTYDYGIALAPRARKDGLIEILPTYVFGSRKRVDYLSPLKMILSVTLLTCTATIALKLQIKS